MSVQSDVCKDVGLLRAVAMVTMLRTINNCHSCNIVCLNLSCLLSLCVRSYYKYIHCIDPI